MMYTRTIVTPFNRIDFTGILSSVLDAQNTVVFNSAGAHISSQLAPTSLAALHGLNGAAAGICLNLYVTKSDILQSAPPHTDKQDVVVIQTQGRKRWRVYSPLDSSMKFHVDPFCRGKGDDGLSVQMLSDEGSELLLDVTLSPGDVLFVPARFPHTTDTLDCYAAEDEQADEEDKYSQNSNNASRSGNHPCAERKSSMHDAFDFRIRYACMGNELHVHANARSPSIWRS